MVKLDKFNTLCQMIKKLIMENENKIISSAKYREIHGGK